MDRLHRILERRKYNNKTHQEEGPITHYEVWFLQAPSYQSIGTKTFTTEQEAHAYAKTLQEEA
jgi:hypothetical protein